MAKTKTPGGSARSMIELSIMLPVVDAVRGAVTPEVAKNEARRYLDQYAQFTVADPRTFMTYGPLPTARSFSGDTVSQIESSVREEAVNRIRLWFDGGQSVVNVYPALFRETVQKLETILTGYGISAADFSRQADALWNVQLVSESGEVTQTEEAVDAGGILSSLPPWALPVGAGAVALIVLLWIRRGKDA